MRLLAIHPNFELYGSDRSFANAISALKRADADIDITVQLPQKGPILSLPVFDIVSVKFGEMWIPRRGDLRNTMRLPAFLLKGLTRIYRAYREIRKYDLVYINTIIALDYIIAAAFSRNKCVIHVREIALGKELKVFRMLLKLSRATLIFNSRATESAFGLKNTQSYVVYNGADVPIRMAKRPPSTDVPLRILAIGRLNSWKGQEILIAAMSLMTPEQRAHLEVRIVGSVFEDLDHFREKLVNQINAAGLDPVITMHPFTDNPEPEYEWADIVVVPSTKPEPFGRVAIEAMAYKAVVVATAHGGPVEIVKDHITGRLVAPADANALAEALVSYVKDPPLLIRHGEAGHQRFLEMFTNAASDDAIALVFKEISMKTKKAQRVAA